MATVPSLKKATQHYAQDAVEAILMGKEIKVTETKSIGCPIKWKNSKSI
jgi:hypothetical protein